VWTPVTDTPVLVDGKAAVVLAPSAATKIFRMRKSP